MTMASVLSKKQKRKEKYTLSELKTLGHQLLSSRAHVNNLPLLLTFVSPTSRPQYVLESLLSLQSFFTPVISDLPSSASNHVAIDASKDDPELIYRTWLRSKFDEFVVSLIDIAVSSESDETLKEVVLDTLMEFVKEGNKGRFHSAIYHKLLQSIVHSATPVDILIDLLVSKYFKYIDVCYFTYVSLEQFTRTFEAGHLTDRKNVSVDAKDEDEFIDRMHYIISRIPPLERSDEKSDGSMWSELGFLSKGDGKKLSENVKAEDKQVKADKQRVSPAKIDKKMKLKFTKAWTSFLRLPLPIDVYKEVLGGLHQAVIPYLSNPIMLCDFLTRSYDIGGVVSVMALSSLFILMTQHGLEYPNFYEKLYALLVPSIFMAKHRARFFQLLDSCLKSPLLPAYLAAAFAKKLSRLSLIVPPSGALVVVALIHNLLRRHPSINCLVHRENIEDTTKDDSKLQNQKPGIDHFNNEETDPIKTRAMRSSLWEIDTLRHHYCPPVSRFVLSLENDLTVRVKTTEIDIKDFSSGSYATIFGEEMRRRVKQVPLAIYKAAPASLFSEPDFSGWSFSCEENKEKKEGNNDNGILSLSEEHDKISSKRQRTECS